MQLYSYQQEAVTAGIEHIKKCIDPALIRAPTGSGKSFMIAGLSAASNELTDKKILVLQPSEELVVQNYEKFLLTGEKASVFSASLGSKDISRRVVFGTPMSVVNQIDMFKGRFAMIVPDEAHTITPTFKKIYHDLKLSNPYLRCIGLTATPYRTTSGYIYNWHYKNGRVDADLTKNPFFHSLIYDIDERYLIMKGYLCQPVIGHSDEHYDTSGMILNTSGKWDQSTVDKAFLGHGRKTANIVADVINKSQNRRGVMFFASSIQHAEEIMASLPPGISSFVHGNMPKDQRRQILKAFKEQRIKYIVNVSVLTTGFDAPHVDCIAVLRKTESPGLYQQIIGRGLRVFKGKQDCLILDYAENIEYHFPGGDIFNPDIKPIRSSGDGELIDITCPTCSYVNKFKKRPNTEGYKEKDGYYLDLDNNILMPMHYGRQCQNELLVKGSHVKCSNKWMSKACPSCGADNDIAARYCTTCRAEIIDPNEKLKELATKIERDPYRIRKSTIVSWGAMEWTKIGETAPSSIKIYYNIEDTPGHISQWFKMGTNRFKKFCMNLRVEPGETLEEAVNNINAAQMPDIVFYKKQKDSKYFDVIGIEYDSTKRTSGASNDSQLVQTDFSWHLDIGHPKWRTQE